MDEINKQLNYCNIYDPCDNYNELINNTFDINLTKKRYERYLKYIKIWRIDNLDVTYIKDLIELYLSTNKGIQFLKKLSKKIDEELIKLI